MLSDNTIIALKKLRHLINRKPDCLFFEANIKFYRFIGLVNDYLVFHITILNGWLTKLTK